MSAYFLVFVILLLSNSVLIFKLYRRYHKEMVNQKVFEEIDPKQSYNQFNFSMAPVSKSMKTEVFLVDNRVANLKAFFRRYNSDLYDHAEKIVEVSDRYKFDYRLLPAIAMQESNLCNVIPYESYNCWGWGIYGNTVTRFESYDEAIETVAKGIKEHYIDKGLITASMIMKKYTPSSNGSWAYGVNTFLRLLE